MQQSKDNKFTAAGTNIEAVKQANKSSGMSYNEAKEFLAKTTGGHGTELYSDTDLKNVNVQNRQSQKNNKH